VTICSGYFGLITHFSCSAPLVGGRNEISATEATQSLSAQTRATPTDVGKVNKPRIVETASCKTPKAGRPIIMLYCESAGTTRKVNVIVRVLSLSHMMTGKRICTKGFIDSPVNPTIESSNPSF
jgi:hypothetical protein